MSPSQHTCRQIQFQSRRTIADIQFHLDPLGDDHAMLILVRKRSRAVEVDVMIDIEAGGIRVRADDAFASQSLAADEDIVIDSIVQ